jgi:hypothetical protein
MKLKLLGAAAAAILSCIPASAAQIVQQAPDETRPFNFFNPALGTLDAVTIRYIVRAYPVSINVLANIAGPLTVGYDFSVPFVGSY